MFSLDPKTTHMITIETKFKPSSLDPTAIGREAIKSALTKLKQIENLVAEVRDPETGQPAKLSWDVGDDGITITIKGSDSLTSELKQRVEALPR